MRFIDNEMLLSIHSCPFICCVGCSLLQSIRPRMTTMLALCELDGRNDMA